ncbi:hypothetical protein [Coralloluteibacterium stylophorae]|uniref:Uncharacterized protein n=1 Tax=Coralloluteibacterium stylophorae TaxID=1776034 RepID=A0A8J7VST5_9GAMM|nr:hypothetical protein [Coralloluteibacterium stylophorae]MBS7458220.1 hypothetical protein [Coralloluteibacterium stylophorae]
MHATRNMEPRALRESLEAVARGEQLPKGLVETLVEAGLVEHHGTSPGEAVLTAGGRRRLEQLHGS